MGVDDAFRVVDRRDFLPEEARKHASEDRPLPIGYGQTNSQPSTVREMLTWLKVEEGQSVLDVGSGSGWTTALLATLTGKKGKVYAVELRPELLDMGRRNCAQAGIANVEFYEATKTFGLPEHAPYDRILVSADAGHFPQELIDQLAMPGRMVLPVGNAIYTMTKDLSGKLTKRAHPGYVFVPLFKRF